MLWRLFQWVRHDVFVSYAHSDNVPVAGTEVGFRQPARLGPENRSRTQDRQDARHLVGPLQPGRQHAGDARDHDRRRRLRQHRGRRVTGVLKSEWCDRERSTFFQWLGRRQSGPTRAVFVVSIEPIGQEKLPGELEGSAGIRRSIAPSTMAGRRARCERNWWSDKEPYYNRLSQLVQNVTDHLEELVTRATAPPVVPAVATPPQEDAAPCVLLLEVTDDLVQRRAELRDYLEQSGMRVLPEKRYSRDDIELHREQMLADFARSRACVQILGPLDRRSQRSPARHGLAAVRHDPGRRRSRCRSSNGATPISISTSSPTPMRAS